MAKYLSESGLTHLWTDILKPLFASKVDKVTGKGLSTLDFKQAYLDRIGGAEDGVTTLGSTKVDKVTGKGLSTNDFTTAYIDQINAAFAAADVYNGLDGSNATTDALRALSSYQGYLLGRVIGTGMMVKSGSVSITTAGGSTNRGTVTVTFNESFAAPPSVIACANSLSVSARNAQPSAIAAGSVDLSAEYTGSTTAVTINVSWIAIGRRA